MCSALMRKTINVVEDWIANWFRFSPSHRLGGVGWDGVGGVWAGVLRSVKYGGEGVG